MKLSNANSRIWRADTCFLDFTATANNLEVKLEQKAGITAAAYDKTQSPNRTPSKATVGNFTIAIQDNQQQSNSINKNSLGYTVHKISSMTHNTVIPSANQI